MFNALKAMVFLLAVLLSSVNYSLNRIVSGGNSLSYYEDTFTALPDCAETEYISGQGSDNGLKIKFISFRLEKIVQKIRILKLFHNNISVFRFLPKTFIIHIPDPVLRADIFSPPDICFPFNYFW